MKQINVGLNKKKKESAQYKTVCVAKAKPQTTCHIFEPVLNTVLVHIEPIEQL